MVESQILQPRARRTMLEGSSLWARTVVSRLSASAASLRHSQDDVGSEEDGRDDGVTFANGQRQVATHTGNTSDTDV